MSKNLTREVTLNAAVNIPDAVWQLPPFYGNGSFVTLEWSHHALEGAEDENFNTAPHVVKLTRDNVVELNVAPGLVNKVRITKIVVRIPSPDKGDDHRDMVMVMVPRQNRGGGWYVISCYANHRDDGHFTLNMERIAPMEEVNRIAHILAN